MGVAVLFTSAIWFVGVGPFVRVHLPVMLLASSIGVWLFYVQHQYEETFWAKDEAWSMRNAALRGSSHYDLPPILRWMTANIGLHHVHHLSSRIPFYRLPHVLRDLPELQKEKKLTLAQSFACVQLTLWDEMQQRLISFGQMSKVVSGAASPCQAKSTRSGSAPK